MLERHSIQKLHSDEVPALLLINFENHADIGVIQGGCRLRLPLEPGQRLGIAGNIVRQELQSYKTVQLQVFRFVDDAHSAATELLNNVVVRDGLADHSKGRSKVASS